jgi:DNA-binding NarL/FixJ family response regulator
MRGLICDDHPLMRQALLIAIRGRWPGVELQEAANFPEAWDLAATGPDFCIVDLAMPGAAPLEGIGRLRKLAPDASLVVLTGLGEESLLGDVRKLGVAAVLPKSLDASALLKRFSELLPQLSGTAAEPLPPRRREVLRLLGQGLTNKAIAARLGIAPATVKIHVSRLIEQLGASNRTDAVSRAQRAGLI